MVINRFERSQYKPPVLRKTVTCAQRGAYFNRGRSYYYKKEKEYDKSGEDIKKAQELGYKIPPEFLEELRKASGTQK